ncbi:MAG: hypothetical protein AB2745_19540 [Candidatus Thiodiazotropha endolucinida]
MIEYFILALQLFIIVGGPLFLIHIKKRVGSYASEVGKITALSKKIDDVVKQQKRITEATEETKANIAHLAWNKKEAQIIKRSKLEKYLEEIFETMDAMYINAQKAHEFEEVEIEEFPVTLGPKLSTIQMLYLPELEAENKEFINLIGNYHAIHSDLSSKKIDAEEFEKQMNKFFNLLGGATKSISLKSQHIIEAMYGSS